MLSAKQSEECVEYGTLTKKVDNGKVSNMLFKDVCICVNMKKKKAKLRERGYFWRGPGEDGMSGEGVSRGF